LHAPTSPLFPYTTLFRSPRIQDWAWMGRHKDPQRKAELLESVAEYLLEHGLAELSLRPLAHAVGTSPRILLYHFGSKEELVASADRKSTRLNSSHRTISY